jgi:AmpE protein
MTFIIILVALSIERFFDWSHMRRFNWFIAFQRLVINKLPSKSPYIILAASIVPLVILVLLIGLILNGFLYGIGYFVFSLFVLLYCLGPKNLWVDSFACLQPIGQPTPEARDGVKQFFNIKELTDKQLLHKQLVSNIFIETNTRLFAVIFWYVLLGPAGALLYRLLALWVIHSEENLPAVREADFLKKILDFLPIRLLTFFFALGGHFARVFPFWSKQVVQNWSNNEVFLAEAGLIAVIGDQQAKIEEDGTAEKSAISLIDRSFVIFLIVILILELLI